MVIPTERHEEVYLLIWSLLWGQNQHHWSKRSGWYVAIRFFKVNQIFYFSGRDERKLAIIVRILRYQIVLIF